MISWIFSIVSVIIVSAISLIGIVFLSVKPARLQKIIFVLVSFAVGGLFGDAFLHLLPESFYILQNHVLIGELIIAGILVFFVLEKFILWRHKHHILTDTEPAIKPLGYMSILADGCHNIIDGVLIGSSYMVNPTLGLTTTVAVILHEIPHEIGNFGVLIHSGFSIKRALWFNFLAACTAILGTVSALVLGQSIKGFSDFVLPFAAGSFIYIAGSDLVPELKKETTINQSVNQFIFIVLGILLLYGFRFLGN
jgi:zinc and cadmium transporter